MIKDSPFADESLSIYPSEYIDYVRKLPCLIEGEAADPHHLKAVGAGRKREIPKWEDYTVIPLQRKFHVELEQIGLKKFELKYDINLYGEALNIVAHWIFHKYKIGLENEPKTETD